MTKPLLLLAALTLCCCISTLHGFSGTGCRCIRTTMTPIPSRFIKKIEIIPISGNCRRTENIITRRNGTVVCVNPKARWFQNLMNNLQANAMSSSTTVSPTASAFTGNF